MKTKTMISDGKTKVDYQAVAVKAIMDIKKGEVVLTDLAAVSFPDPGMKFGGNNYDELESYHALSRRPSTVKVCVGCYCCLDNENLNSCAVCESPICSTSCKKLSVHSDECQIICNIRKNIILSQLLNSETVNSQIFSDFVAVIRLLKFKMKLNALNSTVLANILVMEDFYRSGPFAKHREEDIKTFTLLFKTLEADWFTVQNYDVELNAESMVEHCFMMLNVAKALGIPQSDQDNCYSRLLSWRASFIRHSCVPNVDISTHKDGTINVKALSDIKAGEDLVCCYVNILRPTYDRHVALQVQRLTECRCLRCLDATEFETYLGSVKCQNARCCAGTRGFVVMDTDHNIRNYMDYDNWIWKCINCNNVVDHNSIMGRIDRDATTMKKWSPEKQVDIEFMKQAVDLVNSPYNNYHPGHWLPLLLSKKLASLIGLCYGIRHWKIDSASALQKIETLKQILLIYTKLRCNSSPSAALLRAEILELRYQILKNSQDENAVGVLDLLKQANEIFGCLNHCDSSSKYGSGLTVSYIYGEKLTKIRDSYA